MLVHAESERVAWSLQTSLGHCFTSICCKNYDCNYMSWRDRHYSAYAHQHSILTGSDPKAPEPHSFCVDLVQADL